MSQDAEHVHIRPDPEHDAPPTSGMALLHTLVAQSPEAVLVQDVLTGRIVDVNARAEALYGYTREEFLALPAGWNPRAEDSQAEGPGLFEALPDDTAGGRRPRWHRRKDGSTLPVEVSVSRLTIDGRELVLGAMRDVSAYLDTEAELLGRLIEVEGLLELSTHLSTEDDLRSVLDRIVEGGVRCAGATGGTLAMPEGDAMVYRRLLRRGEWVDRHFTVPVNDSATGRVFLTGITAVINDIAEGTRRYRIAGARSQPRSVILAPVKARDGRVLAVLALHDRTDGQPFSARDTTLAEAAARHAGFALERAQAQADLARRESHYRSLMEQAQDAVLVINSGVNRILDANHSAMTLLGWSLDELRQMDPRDLRHPDERQTALLRDLLASGAPVARVRRLWQRRDGSPAPVEINANYIDEPPGRLTMVVARDTTAHVRAEQERDRLNAEIQARARHMEVLLEVTTALNAAETEEEVIRVVAEHTPALSQSRVAAITLRRGELLLRTFVHPEGGLEHHEIALPPGGSITEHVIRTGRAYRTNDLATDPITDRASDQQMGFRTQLTVPIIGANERVLGIINAHDKVDGAPFTGQDEALLGALASQTGTALERARSRQELAETLNALRLAHGEREVAQRSAEQRGVQLGAMVDLASTVAAGSDVDAVFMAMAERVAQIAGFDIVLLNTYDADAQLITFRTLHHRLAQPPRALLARSGQSFPAGASSLYREFLGGGGAFVGHGTARADTRGFTGVWASATGLDLMATVPLRYEGLLLGDLTFAARQDRELSADDLRLLEALAGQVAVAVHGARDVARIKQMREDAVFRLAAACEARDPETGLHLRRIRSLTALLAEELQMTAEQVDDLSLASVLHDVGKIVVPDAILWKPGRLDPEEFMIVKMHAAQGESMLQGPEFYATARAIARHHHERWDGGGYPDGRSGEAIPWPARIAAVADVYDALVSQRVYKHAWDAEAAAKEVLRHASTHFDPRVVEAFESLWRRDAIAAGMGTRAAG